MAYLSPPPSSCGPLLPGSQGHRNSSCTLILLPGGSCAPCSRPHELPLSSAHGFLPPLSFGYFKYFYLTCFYYSLSFQTCKCVCVCVYLLWTVDSDNTHAEATEQYRIGGQQNMGWNQSSAIFSLEELRQVTFL
jgi:hypothetical protein